MTYRDHSVGTMRGPHRVRQPGRAPRFQFAVRTGRGWVFFHDTVEGKARSAAKTFLAGMKLPPARPTKTGRY